MIQKKRILITREAVKTALIYTAGLGVLSLGLAFAPKSIVPFFTGAMQILIPLACLDVAARNAVLRQERQRGCRRTIPNALRRAKVSLGLALALGLAGGQVYGRAVKAATSINPTIQTLHRSQAAASRPVFATPAEAASKPLP